MARYSSPLVVGAAYLTVGLGFLVLAASLARLRPRDGRAKGRLQHLDWVPASDRASYPQPECRAAGSEEYLRRVL